MTTAELMMPWPRLFESERAEPSLSVMDGPVRVRARVLRPVVARALPARAGRDAPPAYTCSATVAAAVLCCCRVCLTWLASALMSCELLLACRSSRGGS